MSAAERLIAAAALSPAIEAWISLQLKAGRKPSEILVLIGGPLPANDNGRGGQQA
ncbi:hypothetical protein [Mesorhizobium sp. M0129]|uniref:hypothetical protein n=1 Tax=Mesorhizobium sp. M0129 TaxID=2956886 RepID=UPI00333CADDF